MNSYGQQRLQRINELRTEMQEWVEGRRSHTNLIRSVEDDLPQPQILVAIMQADAAEVVKLGAAIQAEAALGESLGWNS